MSTKVLSAFVVSAFGATLTYGAPAKQTNQTLVAAAPTSATTAASPTGTSTASVSSSSMKLIGSYEFVPSIAVGGFKGTGKHESHIENYAELGVQFNPNTSLSYQQGFFINTNDPDPDNAGKGDLTGFYGFFRAKFNNILQDKSAGLSLGYEPRLYMPTKYGDAEKGFVTALRNYIKVTKKFSETFSLTAMDVPILFSYSKAGVGKKANEAFENRIYLIPALALGNVSIELPVIFHQTKYRTFAGAANSSDWGYNLWIFPEVAWAVDPKVQVGVSYESDNLVKADLSKFAITDGFDAGVAHVFLRASL